MQAVAEVESTALRAGPTRAQVEAIEAGLMQLPQIEIRTEHRFAPGVYMREITIPAGAVCTGAAHKHEHLSIMVRGAMYVLADGGMRLVRGYNVWTAPAGVKRVGISLEETVWLTVHRTDATTVEAAEADIVDEPEKLLTNRIARGEVTLDRAADLLELPA